jgi:GNAT superfamily N-acetyltransferase
MRPLSEADVTAGQALSDEQRWPHRIEDWKMMLGLGFGYVAEREGQPVGTVMAWPLGDDAATIGMVIVTQNHQGAGIGRDLMNRVLADLGDRYISLNATEAGLPLYRKLGFVECGAVLQYQGAAFAVPLIDLPPDERLRPMGSKDLPALQALARRATGTNRDALLGALVVGAQGVVLTRNHEPVGFSLFRRFGRGFVIGPTIAPNLKAAKALISHWLGSKNGIFCRLDVPEDSGLAEWLDGMGMPNVSRVVTMRRGTPAPIDPDTTVYSLATQALG